MCLHLRRKLNPGQEQENLPRSNLVTVYEFPFEPSTLNVSALGGVGPVVTAFILVPASTLTQDAPAQA
jgi:hypothetical protein